MDPEANLEQQLDLARRIIKLIDSRSFDDDEVLDYAAHDEATADTNEEIADLANELSDLVVALHEWRSRGGFIPIGALSEQEKETLAQALADYQESVEDSDADEARCERIIAVIDSIEKKVLS